MGLCYSNKLFLHLQPSHIYSVQNVKTSELFSNAIRPPGQNYLMVCFMCDTCVLQPCCSLIPKTKLIPLTPNIYPRPCRFVVPMNIYPQPSCFHVTCNISSCYSRAVSGNIFFSHIYSQAVLFKCHTVSLLQLSCFLFYLYGRAVF